MRDTNSEALELLRSDCFGEFRNVVRKAGLVGERRNAAALFVVGVSRELNRPLSVFIKGPSGSGKNHLVKSVLKFFPPRCIVEITSSSGESWSYLGRDLRHKIIYIQEENKASGNIHPARLLISESRLIRMVTKREGGGFKTERQVTEGPVACISTTTRNRLEVDDESRHFSLWLDDSETQTRRILDSYFEDCPGVSEHELAVWHQVQNLLCERAKLPVELPNWIRLVAERALTADVRVRRQFPAFLDACRAVCLIRSFQPGRRAAIESGTLTVSFKDYAISSLIFDRILEQTLGQGDETVEETRRRVDRISSRNGRAPVGAEELAREVGIALWRAYEIIRDAAQAGALHQSNRPERGNRKLFLPTPRPRFLPEPSVIFEELRPKGVSVQFHHPLTGVLVTYEGKRAER